MRKTLLFVKTRDDDCSYRTGSAHVCLLTQYKYRGINRCTIMPRIHRPTTTKVHDTLRSPDHYSVNALAAMMVRTDGSLNLRHRYRTPVRQIRLRLQCRPSYEGHLQDKPPDILRFTFPACRSFLMAPFCPTLAMQYRGMTCIVAVRARASRTPGTILPGPILRPRLRPCRTP